MEMKIGNRMICNIMLLALVVLFAITNQLEEELSVDYDAANDDGGAMLQKHATTYKKIQKDFISATKKNTNTNNLRNSKTNNAIVTTSEKTASQLVFPNVLMVGVQKGGTSAVR